MSVNDWGKKQILDSTILKSTPLFLIKQKNLIVGKAHMKFENLDHFINVLIKCVGTLEDLIVC